MITHLPVTLTGEKMASILVLVFFSPSIGFRHQDEQLMPAGDLLAAVSCYPASLCEAAQETGQGTSEQQRATFRTWILYLYLPQCYS